MTPHSISLSLARPPVTEPRDIQVEREGGSKQVICSEYLRVAAQERRRLPAGEDVVRSRTSGLHRNKKRRPNPRGADDPNGHFGECIRLLKRRNPRHVRLGVLRLLRQQRYLQDDRSPKLPYDQTGKKVDKGDLAFVVYSFVVYYLYRNFLGNFRPESLQFSLVALGWGAHAGEVRHWREYDEECDRANEGDLENFGLKYPIPRSTRYENHLLRHTRGFRFNLFQRAWIKRFLFYFLRGLMVCSLYLFE